MEWDGKFPLLLLSVSIYGNPQFILSRKSQGKRIGAIVIATISSLWWLLNSNFLLLSCSTGITTHGRLLVVNIH